MCYFAFWFRLPTLPFRLAYSALPQRARSTLARCIRRHLGQNFENIFLLLVPGILFVGTLYTVVVEASHPLFRAALLGLSVVVISLWLLAVRMDPGWLAEPRTDAGETTFAPSLVVGVTCQQEPVTV